jgi:hypothetical protein
LIKIIDHSDINLVDIEYHDTPRKKVVMGNPTLSHLCYWTVALSQTGKRHQLYWHEIWRAAFQGQQPALSSSPSSLIITIMAQTDIPDAAQKIGSRDKNVPWYNPSLGAKLTPSARQLFETYSKIPAESVDDHVYKIVRSIPSYLFPPINQKTA